MSGRRTLCHKTLTIQCPEACVVGRHGVGRPCPGHILPDCHLEAVVLINELTAPDERGLASCARHVDDVAAAFERPWVKPLDTGRLPPMADIIAAHVAAHQHGTSGARYCQLCRHYATKWAREWTEVARARSLERRANA